MIDLQIPSMDSTITTNGLIKVTTSRMSPNQVLYGVLLIGTEEEINLLNEKFQPELAKIPRDEVIEP